MSDKKRRDITLGEMQDECNKREGICCRIESWDACEFYKVCPFQMQSRKAIGWDLSDHPRFNDAQMALLKGFKGVGAERVRVTVYGDSIRTFDLIDRFGNGMSFNAILGIVRDETLDLAELLDSASKT
jgi:hypothetical protein